MTPIEERLPIRIIPIADAEDELLIVIIPLYQKYYSFQYLIFTFAGISVQ
jgi:hypothetical protein